MKLRKQIRGYEEWEDAPEEPKTYWFIDAYGNIVQNEITKHYGDEYTDMTAAYESQKQIGNHFETPEEAEKAVEKLKAWKRLKDTITRIDTASFDDVGTATLFIRYKGKDHKKVSEELDLLSGGEE